SGEVTKIGAAVDASVATIELAIASGIDLLIVHHGLFWPGLRPVTGPLQRALKSALNNDLALYSAHLPLDLHPTLGNNALLAAAIGLQETEPFLPLKGQPAGLAANVVWGREELTAKLQESLGEAVRCIATGPIETKRIGIVTGGAGGEI